MIIKGRRRAGLSGKPGFPFTATPASLSKAGAKELIPREPAMFAGEEECFLGRLGGSVLGNMLQGLPAAGAQPPRV